MSDQHKLTTLNRVYAYFETMLARQGHNGNSCDWFELEHAPDLGLLRQAAAAVAQRHPALQAASRFGGKWTWTRNINAQPDLLYRRLSGACPENIADRLTENVWGRPLDHQAGPPWRLHVTQFDDVTILQSITSHIYTCGKSANLISAELLRAYALLAKGEPPVTTVIDVPNRDNAQLFMPKWTLPDHAKSLWNSLRGMLHEMTTRCAPLAGDRTATLHRGKTRVRFVELGPDLWQQLKTFARAEQISRHPFYIAAWVETIRAFNLSKGVQHEGVIKLIDNFSLRPFAEQDLSEFYDLCAVPYAIQIPYVPSDPDQRRLISTTVETLRGGKILNELTRYAFYHKAVAFLPKVLSTKLVLKAVAKSPFILSNIGPLPGDILGAQPLNVLKYYSFPQLFPPGKIMLMITSTPDTLRAVFLWDEDAISEQEMTATLIPGFRATLARSVGLPLHAEPQLSAAE